MSNKSHVDSPEYKLMYDIAWFVEHAKDDKMSAEWIDINEAKPQNEGVYPVLIKTESGGVGYDMGAYADWDNNGEKTFKSVYFSKEGTDVRYWLKDNLFDMWREEKRKAAGE